MTQLKHRPRPSTWRLAPVPKWDVDVADADVDNAGARQEADAADAHAGRAEGHEKKIHR